jgi:hypothetical protein
VFAGAFYFLLNLALHDAIYRLDLGVIGIKGERNQALLWKRSRVESELRGGEQNRKVGTNAR